MSYVTSFPPNGNPVACAPSGVFGGNTMITGLALAASNSRVFNFIENISFGTPLYVSFGSPVSSTQYHLILNPITSGTPNTFTDFGMIKGSIWVSGGSFIAWSM